MKANSLKEEREEVERALSERIEAHDESRRAAQDRLHEFCEGLRAQVAELKSRVNSELEEKSAAEDRRLQSALSGLRSAANSGSAPEMLQRAKAELLVAQSYGVAECNTSEEDSEPERERGLRGVERKVLSASSPCTAWKRREALCL